MSSFVDVIGGIFNGSVNFSVIIYLSIASLRLFRIGAPTVKFAVMLVAQIAHAPGPIKDGLIVHAHLRRPARDDELFLVARGMVMAARIAQAGELLSQSRSLLFCVRVEEILQLEPGLRRDSVIPKLGNGLGRHRELFGATLRVSLIGLKAAISAALPGSEY
jgi:hypothetical protein